MEEVYEDISADIEKISRIPIIPNILEVICLSTGMGFAAVARVTKEKWVAASVRDEINFGLKPGGELKIQTTICDEIRDSGQAVVIDHVSEDELFCNHHTPAMYGFQSYISVPIILKTGEFFGTLCAIDPNPADLKNPRIIGMFNLFSDLISFHLQSLDLLEKSGAALKKMNRKVSDVSDENRQYRYISNHHLQEPLRKIRIYSSMLLSDNYASNPAKTKEIATKVNDSAQRFSSMIKDLSHFSDLNNTELNFASTDLNTILSEVHGILQSEIDAKGAQLIIGQLPEISVIPEQIKQLFYHLIRNSLKYMRPGILPVISISGVVSKAAEFAQSFDSNNISTVLTIEVSDNGSGIEKSQLDKIFDLFASLPFNEQNERPGFGLSYCRKIVQNHGGKISVSSEPGKGSIFSVILPFGMRVS